MVYSNIVDLEAPCDVIDFGLEVNHLGGMGITEFFRSMHIVDTTNYNGVVDWKYQVIAKNPSASAQIITLKRVTGFSWSPDVFETENALELEIPAGTTGYTLYTPDFEPTTGEWKYYWSVPDVPSLAVITGRPVPTQIGATDTLVWRPLCNRTMVGAFNDHMGATGSRGDTAWHSTSYAGTFYWKPELYLANTVSLILEGTIGSSFGGVVGALALYDITAGALVAGTELKVTSGGAFRWPQSMVERLEFSPSLLTANHLYKLVYRRVGSWGGGITTDWLTAALLGRACLYIKLAGMYQAEVVWRVAKATSGPVVYNEGSSRARIAGTVGSMGVLNYVKNETCSAADFYWIEDPLVDFFITDDGDRISGDASEATDIPESNARQEPVADLLPILSDDWKDNFISNHIFTQRVRPANAGGDANALWTLVCVSYLPASPECVSVSASIDPASMAITGTGSGTAGIEWRIVRLSDSSVLASGTGESASFVFTGEFDVEYQLQFSNGTTWSASGCTFTFEEVIIPPPVIPELPELCVCPGLEAEVSVANPTIVRCQLHNPIKATIDQEQIEAIIRCAVRNIKT